MLQCIRNPDRVYAGIYMQLLIGLMLPQYALISPDGMRVYTINGQINGFLNTHLLVFFAWRYMHLLAGLIFPQYAFIDPLLPAIIGRLNVSKYAFIRRDCPVF